MTGDRDHTWCCRSRRWLAPVLAGVLSSTAVQAQPVDLPYRPQAPFIPVIDLFGNSRKGLILSAEEVVKGRPAPITVGNTTFYPKVRRAGEVYGGYARVNGDLQVVNGDIYLGDQSVGETIQQVGSHMQALDEMLDGHAVAIFDNTSSISRLQGTAQQHAEVLAENSIAVFENAAAISRFQGTVQQHSEILAENSTFISDNTSSISRLQGTAQQHAEVLQNHDLRVRSVEQGIGEIYQSVTAINQVNNRQDALLERHSVSLQQHAEAINGLTLDMVDTKNHLSRIDQNINSLGSGMAGASALVAALASLPVDSQQSPLSCGIGSGGYSNRYALALGCSVSLASSLSLNAGGAYLFGGGSSYGSGSLSNVAGRVGLVYRFGTTNPQAPRFVKKQSELLQDLADIKYENQQLRLLISDLSQRVDVLQGLAQN